MNAAISIGIGLLAQLVVSGIVKAINYEKDLAEASKTAATNLEQFNETVRDQNNTMKTLAPEYTTLSQGVDSLGRNIDLASEKYARYHEITNQIAEMFPTLVAGYDAQGNAILKIKGNLQELTEAYHEAQQRNAGEYVANNAEGIQKGWKYLQDNDNKAGRNESRIDVLHNLEKLNEATTDINSFKEAYQELSLLEQSDVGLPMAKITDENFAQIAQQIRDAYNEAQVEVDAYMGHQKQMAQSYLMANKDYFTQLDETAQSYATHLVTILDESMLEDWNGNLEGYTSKIVSSLKNDSTFRDAMTDIFSLKDADLPVDEAWQKLDAAIKILADRLQLDENTLKIQLGFEDMDSLKHRAVQLNE